MWNKWFSSSKDTDPVENNLYNAISSERLPRHIAIIMDGNGRWAKKRGLQRTFGHKMGAEALRSIVKTCSEVGIEVLTVYAFSTENWKRPVSEVSFLMNLLSDYLDNEIEELHNNHVKICFLGIIEELDPFLQQKISFAEQKTENNSGLILNLAVNYGGRAEIVRAVKIITDKVLSAKISKEEINERLISSCLYTAGLPDPDLLIRPSGDLRISNYLLWQCAYTEFWFTDVSWPDFEPRVLLQAIRDYQQRERRYGGLK